MPVKVQARISDELAALLDAEVNRLQGQHPAAEVNRSTVVRAALTEYLNKKEDSTMQTKYRGIVKDDLRTLDPKHTKWYDTYFDAHQAAEKLCKRTYGDRGSIDVETRETASAKRIIRNIELAQAAYDAIHDDTEHEYRDVTYLEILEQIDIGREPKDEDTPADESLISTVIANVKQIYEVE